MYRKAVLIVCLVLAMVVGLALGDAYAGGHGKGKSDLASKLCRKAHLAVKNADELGLSDEQVDKIKDLKLATKKDVIKKKADIELIILDIKSMMCDDTINLDEINKLIDKKYEIKKAKAKSLVGSYAAFKNILSEEQQDKLKELCEEQSCKKSCETCPEKQCKTQ